MTPNHSFFCIKRWLTLWRHWSFDQQEVNYRETLCKCCKTFLSNMFQIFLQVEDFYNLFKMFLKPSMSYPFDCFVFSSQKFHHSLLRQKGLNKTENGFIPWKICGTSKGSLWNLIIGFYVRTFQRFWVKVSLRTFIIKEECL